MKKQYNPADKLIQKLLYSKIYNDIKNTIEPITFQQMAKLITKENQTIHENRNILNKVIHNQLFDLELNLWKWQ